MPSLGYPDAQITFILSPKVRGQGPRAAPSRSGRPSGGREGQGALPPDGRMLITLYI